MAKLKFHIKLLRKTSLIEILERHYVHLIINTAVSSKIVDITFLSFFVFVLFFVAILLSFFM